MKTRPISVALSLLYLFSMMFLNQAAVSGSNDTIVCVDPPTTIAAAGKTFEININVSNVVDLYGWEFKLSWNQTLLDAVNVTEGSFLKGSGDTFFTDKINNTEGYVLVACTLLGDVPGVSGSGILATVEFYVEEEGEGVLDLYDTKLVSSLEQSITHTAMDGYFTSPTGPTANFTYLAQHPYRTVTFNASTSLPGWNGTHVAPIVNYEWDFGDGNTTEVPYPIIDHTYTANDTYTVTLNVTDSQGLWDTTLQTITLSIDVAITDITPSATEAYTSWIPPLNINVTVKNEGVTTATFNVTAYYTNETYIASIGTKIVTKMAPGTEETLSFAWDLSDVSVDKYTISANASVVLNETDTADNSRTDGIVKVKFPGDVDGDGFIGGYDATMVSTNWWTSVAWGHDADFNNDGFVGGFDATLISIRWWTSVPKP